MRLPFIALTCLFTLILSGCATNWHADQTSTPKNNDGEATPAAATDDQPIQYRDFEPETLYTLMAAEIAAQRGRYDITLVNYVQAAKRTHDIGVIKRAMRIARAFNGDNAQMQLAKTWLEVDPDSIEAHQISALQDIKHKRYEGAVTHMEAIARLGGDADFDNLAAYAETLSPDEQQQLLMIYTRLLEKHPENEDLLYSFALLQKSSGDSAAAIKILAPLLDKSPDYQPALLLQGTLMFETGKIEDALSYLRKQSRRFPENRKLGTLYARMLIDDKQLQAAEDEFQQLMLRFPDAPGLKLSHALVALENGRTQLAAEELQSLIDAGQNLSEAHYYLGRIADDAHQDLDAIVHYQQVDTGPFFFSALSRTSFLMAKRGEISAALERLANLRTQLPQQTEPLWLVEINLQSDLKNDDAALSTATRALEALPDNGRILYARAMAFDRMDNLSAAEADLNRIIQQEPDNAVAMNALGYLLTTKTKRYDEALQLLLKAHQIAPDNAAITDSLGWIYYKLGDMALALQYIEAAYADFKDPEVAAHYGEILWVSGQQTEARRIWEDAIKDHPDNAEAVHETLQRLQVDAPQK